MTTMPTIDLRWDPDPSSVPWTMSGPVERGSIDGMSVSELQARTLAELGLDPDRPVIVVGHQPEPWHPGILAKFMLGDLLAARHDAQLVHLVVDAHRGAWNRMEWPSGVDADSFATASWKYLDGHSERPMCREHAKRPRPVPDAEAMPGVLDGLHAWHAALEAECGASNAALQCAGALNRLMKPWVAAMRTITVSQLMETSVASLLLGRMSTDTPGCVAAFNGAVDRHPTLGVRRLQTDADSSALPLWIEQGDALRTARMDDLHCDGLHPKALLLTSLARVGVADLFIHGLGGWRYDEAMEDWMGAWLGVRPSPRAMVTADLRLPILGTQWLESNRNGVLQQGRRRRHDPETSGATRGPGPIKAKALAEIASLPRGSHERRLVWDRMHEWIDRRIEGEVDQDDALRRIEELTALSVRRDWPFPLYDGDALDVLKRALETELD